MTTFTVKLTTARQNQRNDDDDDDTVPPKLCASTFNTSTFNTLWPQWMF